MRKTVYLAGIVAGVLTLAALSAFAQQKGKAVYMAKCASCHGANGTAPAGIAKAMHVKAANDPAIKAHSEAQMLEVTRKGAGKMPGYAGKLTDAEIKDSVAYFRFLGK